MLFASYKYHISSSFPSTRIEELKHVLDGNGACEIVSGEGWLNEVNLVVSNSMKFEGWEEVKERNKSSELGVYVVTDKWVDRSLVLGKIQSPHHYSPDPSLIFSGVIACATALPPSDLEVLSAGITALGGQWRTGLTKDVTHLFAMSPDSQKYATAMHFREETGVKVVLPHWFDDVVRLGMGGLSTDVYEWPDPELLRNPLGVGGGGSGNGVGGPELSGVKKNMYALAALFTTPMHESSSPPLKDFEIAAVTGSRVEVDVWKGKKIVLSRTLQLFEGRREAVEVGIRRAGGVVVRYDGDEEVDEGFAVLDGPGELSKREKERRKNEAEKVLESDVLVTRWRDGAAYIAALRSHKTIGTLAWLFHVQSTGTLTRPLDQLLHYPVPKRPIEAFAQHVITVTNYTGEAREYLKKLIVAMGAKFTPSMSGQNTVLIAAYMSGTKSTKAQSWSIPIVNHTWLEDCFIQWRNLTVGLEKYIGFPNGVDFSRLLGMRGVGTVEAEGLEGEVDGAEGEDGPHGTDASVKEVRGLIVSEDVDMVDVGVREEKDPAVTMDVDEEKEGEKTPTKKTYDTVSKPKVDSRRDTSPIPKPTSASSRISPKKTALEHGDPEEDEEVKTNGKQKRRTKKWMSSEDEEEEEPIRIPKSPAKEKSEKLASEDEIMDEDEESENVPPKTVKTNSKEKKGKEKQDTKVHSRSKQDSEVEVVLSSKIAKTDLSAKGKGKERVAVRSKKSKGADDEDEDEDEDLEEHVEEAAAKTKKAIKVQSFSTKSKAKYRDQDEDEESEEEEEEEEEKSKSKGVAKVGNKRKLADDDDDNEAEEDEEAEDFKSKSRSKPIPKVKPTKAVTTSTKLTVSNKPTSRSTKVRIPTPAGSDDSEDELSFALQHTPSPPPRARSTKLIKRVSGVVPDARTRVRKRKVSVVEVEVDEEEEEPVVLVESSSSEGKTSVKAKGKKKSRVHVQRSDSEDEDEDEVTQQQLSKTKATKKSVKESMNTKSTTTKSKSAKPKPTFISDSDDDAEKELEDVQQPTDSDSDIPTTLFINRNKGKHVSAAGGSTSKSTSTQSISAPAKVGVAAKLKARKGRVESEDDVVLTPKRAISVLMPSLNLSGNKKGGMREVEKKKSGKGKKTKLSVSSAEEEGDEDEELGALVSPRSRAITRTESIRVTSNHQVQASTKARGSTSSVVKKNTTAVTSLKSKSKSKIAPMNIDTPSPSPPPHTTKTSPKMKPPSPTFKRSAATKATQILHDTVMPDLVHFESQMKRANVKGRKSGGLMAFKVEGESEAAGNGNVSKRRQVGDVDGEEEERVKKRRRVDDDDDARGGVVVGSAKGKGKRKVREEEEEEEEGAGAKKKSSTKVKGKAVVIVASEEEEDVVVVSSSKEKTKNKGKEEAETPPKSGVVLLTTQVTLSDEVIRTLTKLGVKFTSRPSECTHLLAPQLVRTEKFLCALVVAPFILTEKWAVRSAAAKKLLPEKDFALHDMTGENKYGVDLKQSLRRAKELGGKLLAGQTFYVTPKVLVDTRLLKNVVNACGGQVSTQQPTIRIINASPENRHVISCKEDVAIWRPIAAQGIPIYSQELLLTGALKQKMDWDGDGIRVDDI